MTREEAISQIESLYPPDSSSEVASQIGQELLAQAKQELGWRAEPTEVLIRMAQLCIEEDYKR